MTQIADTDMTDAPRSAGGSERRTQVEWRSTLARFALPLVMLAFIVFFAIMETGTFVTARNARAITANNAVIALVAVAFVIPLTVREFDLSVGANLGLAAIMVTGLPSSLGLPLLPSILIAVLASTGVGLFNGFFVARIGLNSLVVTLGSSTIITGAVFWFTGGSIIYEGIPTSLTGLTSPRLLGIPMAGVYMIMLVLIVWYVLEHTPLGRYLYAVGGSKEASALAGLNVRRLTMISFVWAGCLAGLAGVMQASMMGSGSPTVGPSFLLPAVAAAFLGATTIRIGTFNALGTVIAVYTIAVGATGIQLMGAPFYIEPIFQGIALLVAVTLVRVMNQEVL